MWLIVGIITCPYCLQNIDTENRKIKFPKNLRCPKCKLIFKCTEVGEERIASQLRYEGINSSIRLYASHY